MKEDFLAVLIGNGDQARILRTLVFNEGERLTPRELGKRAGMTAESAVRELESLARRALGDAGRGEVRERRVRLRRKKRRYRAGMVPQRHVQTSESTQALRSRYLSHALRRNSLGTGADRKTLRRCPLGL